MWPKCFCRIFFPFLLLSCSMKKIILIALPFALLICGFSIKTILTKKDTLLNHIALHVYDLQTSTAFYEEIIQLDSIPEPFHDGKHTWLSVGANSHLHLISGAPRETTHDKFTHLCFTVASMPEFISRLDKAQVHYEDWAGAKSSITTRVDGIKQIYFQDPDGYWIEINDDYK